MKERPNLPIALRLSGRPVVLVGEGPVADEHRKLLRHVGATIVGEGSKATFAIVIDDPGAVSRLKVRGALVHAVGRPDLSDFVLTQPSQRKRVVRKGRRPVVRRTPRKLLAKPQQALVRIAHQGTSGAMRLSKAAAPLALGASRRIRPVLLAGLRPFAAVAEVMMARLQTRVDKARERPVSLNLVLAKGGPLDQPGATELRAESLEHAQEGSAVPRQSPT